MATQVLICLVKPRAHLRCGSDGRQAEGSKPPAGVSQMLSTRAGWLAGWLAGWRAGWLAGLLACNLAGLQAGGRDIYPWTFQTNSQISSNCFCIVLLTQFLFSNPVSRRQCLLIHFANPRRFFWPNLAYMCPKVALKPHSSLAQLFRRMNGKQ